MNEIILINDFYHMNCPHCEDEIIVYKDELNCKIFRHGIYKDSYQQINPHMNKINCDKLVLENKVYGCAKPFQIIKIENKLYITICDYI